MEMSGVVASMRKRFHQASREWHRLLGLDTNRFQVWTGQKRKRVTVGQGELQPNAVIAYGKRLRRMNIVDKLKKMLGVDAEFRGCQQAVIQYIMRRENCVVQEMSTGGGKSLSFILPAWCGLKGVVRSALGY